MGTSVRPSLGHAGWALGLGLLAVAACSESSGVAPGEPEQRSSKYDVPCGGPAMAASWTPERPVRTPRSWMGSSEWLRPPSSPNGITAARPRAPPPRRPARATSRWALGCKGQPSTTLLRLLSSRKAAAAPKSKSVATRRTTSRRRAPRSSAGSRCRQASARRSGTRTVRTSTRTRRPRWCFSLTPARLRHRGRPCQLSKPNACSATRVSTPVSNWVRDCGARRRTPSLAIRPACSPAWTRWAAAKGRGTFLLIAMT